MSDRYTRVDSCFNIKNNFNDQVSFVLTWCICCTCEANTRPTRPSTVAAAEYLVCRNIAFLPSFIFHDSLPHSTIFGRQ